ncbi:hypothetical protein L226DRAFT_570127 [Lentinus tigrinus ALCF2SS1-7]|uniref:uncharacterized protein n=1 Tax=Lentinus tigrinus ALCF2SS1-7 TaxID=1328758 RepID=UPI0011662C16|nr:hypothetical protein L226DRAFT_570127 [Lentinus tigrinus ALCF2SS1-7]
MSQSAQSLDLNWLAYLLYGLYEESNDSHPHESQLYLNNLDSEDRVLKHYATILDSLARLLIYEERNQVVSIAVVLPELTPTSQGPAEFLVAHNGCVSPQVVGHLKTIITLLREARLLYVQEVGDRGMPPKLSIPTLDASRKSGLEIPLIEKLQGLERSLHRYCWEKERRRVTKDDRYGCFHRLVDAVTGVSDQPANRTPEEHTALQSLQEASSTHRAALEEVHDALFIINQLLSEDPDARHAFIPESSTALDALIAAMRVVSHHASDKSLKSLWSLCDRYNEAVLARRQAERDRYMKLKASQPPSETQSNDKKLPHITPTFSTERWLLKARDFSQISRTVVSSRLAGLFEHVTPEVSPVSVKQPKQEDFFVSVEKVTSTLKLAGWKEDDIEEFAETFVDGLKQRASLRSGPIEPSDDGTFSQSSVIYCHCECDVLAELHERFKSKDRQIIPYVGVSKLSCALCHLYFECYREATDSTICTRGTHGQIWPWITPTLLKDEAMDEKIKTLLAEKLKGKLVTEAKNARTRQRASQSTVGFVSNVVETPHQHAASALEAMMKVIKAKTG